ncbi:3-isopropylmalate dehydrogenase [Thiotrichales bacterium 19S3-7]|nr:3-isopropylmalate dehydrogenase [Thiotrichales bacterium 19S3-7]MCF6801304.1 3-isopropylmalate dehydrogenase [Thiotrichales bacterium 19S3-11]
MKRTIAILAGDGIGAEVMDAAVSVLKAIETKYNHQFNFKEALVGGSAYDQFKHHCPDETLTICKEADAILFGSVGGPVDAQTIEKWRNCEANSILALRKHFKFAINIRPIVIFPALKNNSPLNPNAIGDDVNIEIFRELSADIYFGEHKRFINDQGIRCATDVAQYDEHTIRTIVRAAFKRAQVRNKKLTSVDKANVLDTSRLWREIVEEEALNYPDVKLNHMYVDNCAMQMILNPRQFDVMVTSNLFGDILSDLGSVLPGSIGLVPSVSLNNDGFGLYEPSGGSAYDLLGKNIANPTAQILSASLMLAYSFGLHKEANDISRAVECAFEKGYKTADINHNAQTDAVTTTEFTKKVIEEINAISDNVTVNNKNSEVSI